LLDIDGEVEEFLVTPSDECAPCFSPDGKWIAYVSDQSGLDEVYVRPYARGQAPGSRIAISTWGGIEPRWSPDGRELYYRRRTQLYAVSFEAGQPATAGRPQLLFDEPYHLSPVGRGNPNYDVAPDGRFLMIRSDEAQAKPRVHVVQGLVF
jgi:Tol biopolymer transport system component